MRIINLRMIIICIVFILLVWLVSPAVTGQTEKSLAAQSTVQSIIDPAPLVSAQSAIVIELGSGRILYEKNAQSKAYPASTTKIMTALLAIEKGDMDSKVTISQNASGVEGSSMYLAAGEKISLRDLVYGLMLRSGNDAAIAISEFIGGSTEEFVQLMNERAVEIKALNTHFVNPNGLFNENHYTTVYDMALMAREAMLKPEFKTIVGSKSWVADRDEGKYKQFYNKNKVVFEYEGGTGVKIGYTKASVRTLVASSERNGMELICVVMNAPNWFDDSYKLMDYAYENYEMKKIASAERILKAVLIDEGDKNHVFIGPKEDIFCPVPKSAENEISITYVLYKAAIAPVTRWQEAGEVEIYSDGNYLFSQPLYFLEDIAVDLTRRKK